MRWQVVEIREFLKRDQRLHLLFVEGDVDLTLWRHIVPEARRLNAAIYKIGSVDIPNGGLGGEKGRSLALAGITQTWPEGARVAFFVDDDGDRFLGRINPPNVTETDGRDMEAYAICNDVLSWVCMTVGATPADVPIVKAIVSTLLRPIGLLRIADARHGWRLPFQATFADGSVTRFFVRKRGKADALRLTDLVHALLDEADLPRSRTSGILRKLAEEEAALASAPDEQIVHGKDFIATLAWHFKTRLDAADGAVRVSTAACPATLLNRPNIQSVHHWVTAA